MASPAPARRRVRSRPGRRPRPRQRRRPARPARLDRPRMPAAARRPDPRPTRSHAEGAAFAMTDAVRVARPGAAEGPARPKTSLPAGKRRLDAESQEWLDALTGTGRRQQDAVERLHELLLRAARFELARRRRAVADLRPGELDDLATQAADDALMAILRKLHSYRGDSRFTTWAYKFALFEAAAKVRRRAWQGREIPLETDAWARLVDDRPASPDVQAEAS